MRLSPQQKIIHDLEKKISESESKFDILKNGTTYLCEKKQMVFHFIESNEKKYSIRLMCKVLGIGTGTYRRWKNQFVSANSF